MTFLGRYIETSVVPNQQIVVQFSDTQIAENESQNAIEAIQLKLQVIGVKDIQVGEDQHGQLKITYFSNADIEQIEDILSNEKGLKFAHNSNKENSNRLPKKKKLRDYEINISEIQNGSDTNLDLEGVQIVEHNHKSDRFNKTKENNSGTRINSESYDNLQKIRVKSFNTIALAIDNLSFKIPDVRAGPTA